MPSITAVFPSSSWTARLGVLHNIGVEPAGSTMSTWKYLWFLFLKNCRKICKFPTSHILLVPNSEVATVSPHAIRSTPSLEKLHFFQTKKKHRNKPTELNPALSPGRLGSSPKSPSSNLHLVAQLCALHVRMVFFGGTHNTLGMCTCTYMHLYHEEAFFTPMRKQINQQ